LNLGVRWEYGPPLTIAHNIYIRFEPATGHMLVAAVNASPSEHQHVVKNHVSHVSVWRIASIRRP
jgi:hypothetical protein